MQADLTCVQLTAEAARALTDEVKADAAALWNKLLKLYEGGAHLALGYNSWQDYARAEFDLGKSRSYQLLDSGRVLDALDAHSTTVERPASEAVTRELAGAFRKAPAQMAEAWTDAVREHGPKPTAAQIRETLAELGRNEPAGESPSIEAPAVDVLALVKQFYAKWPTDAYVVQRELSSAFEEFIWETVPGMSELNEIPAHMVEPAERYHKALADLSSALTYDLHETASTAKITKALRELEPVLSLGAPIFRALREPIETARDNIKHYRSLLQGRV